MLRCVHRFVALTCRAPSSLPQYGADGILSSLFVVIECFIAATRKLSAKESTLFKVLLPAPLLSVAALGNRIFVLHAKGIIVVPIEAQLQSVESERSVRVVALCRYFRFMRRDLRTAHAQRVARWSRAMVAAAAPAAAASVATLLSRCERTICLVIDECARLILQRFVTET